MTKNKKNVSIPKDMEKNFLYIYKKCKDFSMTSIERMYSMYKATEYISKNNIGGAIVECGTWKGGSSMVSAYMLKSLNDTSRVFFLYDTFSGMSTPTEKDINHFGVKAESKWRDMQKNNKNEWCFASIDEVKKNILSTGYPEANISFIKGKVEETIPKNIPDSIAILRLDTDWFESTYHELKYLFPLLSKGGVIIIDDYGHWKGAKDATEQYFKENNIKIFLNRIDYTGRIAVKQ